MGNKQIEQEPETEQDAELDRVTIPLAEYTSLEKRGFFNTGEGNEVLFVKLVEEVIKKLCPNAQSYVEFAPGGGGMMQRVLDKFKQIKHVFAVELVPKSADKTRNVAQVALSNRQGASCEVVNGDANCYLTGAEAALEDLSQADLPGPRVVVCFYAGDYLIEEYIQALISWVGTKGGVVIVGDGIRQEEAQNVSMVDNMKLLFQAYGEFGLLPPLLKLLRASKIATLFDTPEFKRMADIHYRHEKTLEEWDKLEASLCEKFPGTIALQPLVMTKIIAIPVPSRKN